MPLRPRVREALQGHGLDPSEPATPESLRERLNDLYLEEVRRLKQRRVAGEIPAREYAGHVERLRDRFPLLGLPLSLWSE
jgi:hypothetical protein